MGKAWILITGLIFLLLLEIARVYFIMPFPGSQQQETITLAYFLHRNILWMRIAGWILVLVPAWYYLSRGRSRQRWALAISLGFYGLVVYLFNFRFLADKMFHPPSLKIMAPVSTSMVDSNALVVALSIHGQAAAYPVEFIGYHHQVPDTLGGVPILVTYCTVCRTGRVFSPLIDGEYQQFLLVGMDYFNAMFEDAGTHSWWRQESGEAVAGPMAGRRLTEIPSIQTRLGSWIRDYPQTKIFQGDPGYTGKYLDLQGYDSGTIRSSLEKRDSSSWKLKSWVIGVLVRGHAKAYDWNFLQKERMISDSLGSVPVLLVLENDGASFHLWNRQHRGQTLQFIWNAARSCPEDKNTHAAWNWDGTCAEGALKGERLESLPAYQEFWHSWSRFHPHTEMMACHCPADPVN